MAIKITIPFTDEVVESLHIGDAVRITGSIYTARDAAHKRLVEMMVRGEPMPFDFAGAAVYYAGPSPTRPGAVVGSIGPTTSGRMDVYAPTLMARGLKVMIGKGLRDDGVRDAIVQYSGLYLAAIGVGILITDHNVQETLSITDRAYLLYDGKILQAGTAEHLASDPEVRRVYLGTNFELRKKKE